MSTFAKMAVLVGTVALCGGGAVRAGSHLWRINEIFSDASGVVQFVELHECCGATHELHLRGIEFTSDATGSVFTFPNGLEPPTSRRFLLLATEAFTALPGVPQPDFILPDGFLSTDGDLLWYGEAQNYDKFAFAAGDLPIDGLHSIQLTDFSEETFAIEVNTPTNYQGETGTIQLVQAVSLPFRRGDCDADGDRTLTDAVFLLGALFLAPKVLPCDDSCDANDDGTLGLTDAVGMLTTLFTDPGPLPPPTECAVDPTEDSVGCLAFPACL